MAGSEAKQVGRFGYREAGRGDDRTIMFLHGIGGAARMWERQLQSFAGDYRTLAWDMPGYGASGLPEHVTVASLAGDLAAFLAATGADRPILVGHSIGGMIVQQYLAENPDGARAAVLAQTSAAFGSRDGAWQEQFIRARFDPLDRGETMAEMAPGMVADLVAPGADPAGVALARACMAAVAEASYRATVRSMLGFDQRANLPLITVPVLLLAGSDDRNAPAPTMERMAQKIPGAAYTCLPATGHLANLEQPDAFDDALRAFLAALPPRAGDR
jgi:3-oxoadipate enol-lactonase